jgi:signal transduction histidine kinase
LLNYSQTSQQRRSSEEESIDLNTLVLNLIHSLQLEANQKNIFINFEEPPYLSKIKANSNQVQTILRNLFRNAVYYADKETTITVKLIEKNNIIEFSINNKGMMIPAEYHKKVFEKYYKLPGQTHERAGLGLYITKKHVRDLGGKIGLKSTEKQGTTFWVHFPIAQE